MVKTLSSVKYNQQSKQLYDDAFDEQENKRQNLTFATISESFRIYTCVYFMPYPLRLTEEHNTDRNLKFKNEFLKALKVYEAVGFVVTLKKPTMYHMIGGLVFPKLKIIELYDPNAKAMYPLRKLEIKSTNNLYELVFGYMNGILARNDYKFYAHVDNSLVPGTCGILEKGICSLWSIIYVILRLTGKSTDETHTRIREISKSSISTSYMLKLMKSIQTLKSNKNKINFDKLLYIVKIQNV
tara:strand:+ start:42 stop:764 length:723 start_codon:yes stop_codon:yes gene_type:complete